MIMMLLMSRDCIQLVVLVLLLEIVTVGTEMNLTVLVANGLLMMLRLLLVLGLVAMVVVSGS